MNGRKAKALRRMAREAAELGPMMAEKTLKRYKTGPKKEDVAVVDKYTIRHTGQRRLYQDMKRGRL